MGHCRVKRLWLIHRCSRRLTFHGCVISAISTSLCLGVCRLQERRPVRILRRRKELLTRTLLIGILLGLVILEDGEGRQQAFLSLAIGWHNATDSEILRCWLQISVAIASQRETSRHKSQTVFVPSSKRKALVIRSWNGKSLLQIAASVEGR